MRYWRNRGDGRFDLPRTMEAAPAGVRLGDPGVQLLDANGNGRTDLMVIDRLNDGYYPLFTSAREYCVEPAEVDSYAI